MYNLKNEEEFKFFTYKYFCQCKTQCLEFDKNYFNKIPNIVCTQIIIDSDIEDYNLVIKNVIDFFINEELLKNNNNNYYIRGEKTRLKLSWDNIKNIENKNKKELFWLFRKVIIDSIIKHIIKNNNLNNLKIYSVGSTNLDSDYDITLYGLIDDKIILINKFNEIFKNYFTDESASVFDTNIYGKAYITYYKKEYDIYGTLISNCGDEFYYLNSNPEPYSQLMWGFVKYLKDIREGFGEHMYFNIFNYMNNKINNEILKDSHNVFVYLKNQPQTINYNYLLSKQEELMYNYKNKLIGYHDYLSVLNFYGNETYFTRGPFLDIVINTQMCKSEIITLDEIDYITSILENAGFYFIHNNKTKYVIRVYNTLNNLINKFKIYNELNNTRSYSKFIKIIKNLETKIINNNSQIINYDNKYCKDLLMGEEFDLLSCEKYELFMLLITIIFKIISIFTQHNKYQTPYFYQYIVNSNFDELVFAGKIQTTISSPVKSNDKLLFDYLPESRTFLKEIDIEHQKVYKKYCINKEDLIGNTLNVSNGNIVILDISKDDKYVVWCFTYEDSLKMLYDINKTYNIFYTGQLVDLRGVLLSRIYNTFVLRNTNKIDDNSNKYVFTLDPIPQNVLKNKIKINKDVIDNFKPGMNDLNVYYINNPFTYPNNNKIIINDDEIKGNLATIILQKPLINIVKIHDSNKQFKIIGNIISNL
jgi:hypothetical protein